MLRVVRRPLLPPCGQRSARPQAASPGEGATHHSNLLPHSPARVRLRCHQRRCYAVRCVKMGKSLRGPAMRRTTAIITLVALFSTLGLIGCGRKAKPDSDESAGAASSSTPPRRAPSNPNPQPPTGDPQPPGVLPFGTGEPDPMRTEMDPTTPDPMAVTSPQPKVVPTPPVVSPKDPNPMTGVPPQPNPMPPPPAKDPPPPPGGP